MIHKTMSFRIKSVLLFKIPIYVCLKTQITTS